MAGDSLAAGDWFSGGVSEVSSPHLVLPEIASVKSHATWRPDTRESGVLKLRHVPSLNQPWELLDRGGLEGALAGAS